MIVVKCGCNGESGWDSGEEEIKWGEKEWSIFRAIVNEYNFGKGRRASSLGISNLYDDDGR